MLVFDTGIHTAVIAFWNYLHYHIYSCYTGLGLLASVVCHKIGHLMGCLLHSVLMGDVYAAVSYEFFVTFNFLYLLEYPSERNVGVSLRLPEM